MADSMLSTEERRVAERLAAGETAAEIAAATDRDPEVVEKAVARVREKTDRALATLLASPYAAEAAADLPEAERERLREVLSED